MHPPSPKTSRSTSTSQQSCAVAHDWRLQGLVRTHKGQVEYYQCQRCLEPRRDVRPWTPRRDRGQ